MATRTMNGGPGIPAALLLAALAAGLPACGQAEVTPGCTSSSCPPVTCEAGRGDCDGVAANGCEASLTTLTDCGACGVACAFAHGAASCAAGKCALASCEQGFSDCDGDPSNGCEALPCGAGGHCVTGADCESGACDGGLCVAPSCTDKVKNGAETDVDCGGGACPACAVGGGCAGPADCASSACASGVCVAPGCTDLVKNGAETGVDCGGGACPPCAAGGGCASATDCDSGVCASSVCAAPSCTDLVKNGAETAVDCGGPCPGCGLGQACALDTDCTSGACTAGTCQLFGGPGCFNGIQDGSETGVDCGGCACAPCGAGLGCTRGSECQSGVCVGGGCQAPTCFDDVKNGGETGIDCGGPCASCQPASAPVVVSTLLHFDGGLAEQTGKVVTLVGGSGVTAAESRFGTGSMYFDGSTYLDLGPSPDFDFGTGDFTVEYWFKELPPQSGYEGFVELVGSNSLNVAVGAFLIWPVYENPQVTLSATSFDHYAIVRRGDTLRGFRNGVWLYSVPYTGTVGAATDKLRIGFNTNNGSYLTGYLDELRITKGLARYPSDFSPATAPFALAESCAVGSDCPTGVCAAGTCAASLCSDGVKNGAETAVDCGGDVACPGCAVGKACSFYGDCAGGVCEGGTCRASGDVVLLHFDGPDGSTVFTEATGKPVTLAGTGTIQGANVAFGTGAGYFDGATSLTIPAHHSFDLRCGDWTIEYFYKELPPQSTYEGFLALESATLNVAVGTFLISPVYFNSGLTLDTASFQHYAVVRSGDTLEGFYKGNLVYSTPYAGAVGAPSDAIVLGYNANNSAYLTGYLDEVRITKGLARYTASFPPPAAAFAYP